MNFEFGGYPIRFLVSDYKSGTPYEPEWTWVLDGLPEEGERVLCWANKTVCCDLDMDEAQEHEAVFTTKDGCPSFEIEDELYHLMYVSKWKSIKKS